jgi:hypothetical protein
VLDVWFVAFTPTWPVGCIVVMIGYLILCLNLTTHAKCSAEQLLGNKCSAYSVQIVSVNLLIAWCMHSVWLSLDGTCEAGSLGQ